MSTRPISPSLSTSLNANAKPFVPKFGVRSAATHIPTPIQEKTQPALPVTAAETVAQENGKPISCSSSTNSNILPPKLNANANEFIPRRKIQPVQQSTSTPKIETQPAETVPETSNMDSSEPTPDVNGTSSLIVDGEKKDASPPKFRARGPEVKLGSGGTEIQSQNEKAAPEYQGSSMPLSTSWTIYGQAPAITGDHSTSGFQPTAIVTVQDVESMWGTINNIPLPSLIYVGSTYYFFKSDIEPRWEHPGNEKGGCWIIMVRHDDVRNRASVLDPLWEELILGVLGGELDNGKKEVNGLVCKVRAKQFTFQIWTRSCHADLVSPVGEAIRKLITEVWPGISTTSSSSIEFYSHQQLEKCTSKTSSFSRIQPKLSM